MERNWQINGHKSNEEEEDDICPTGLIQVPHYTNGNIPAYMNFGSVTTQQSTPSPLQLMENINVSLANEEAARIRQSSNSYNIYPPDELRSYHSVQDLMHFSTARPPRRSLESNTQPRNRIRRLRSFGDWNPAEERIVRNFQAIEDSNIQPSEAFTHLLMTENYRNNELNNELNELSELNQVNLALNGVNLALNEVNRRVLNNEAHENYRNEDIPINGHREVTRTVSMHPFPPFINPVNYQRSHNQGVPIHLVNGHHEPIQNSNEDFHINPVNGHIERNLPSEDFHINPVNGHLERNVPSGDFHINPVNGYLERNLPSEDFHINPVNGYLERNVPSEDFYMNPVSEYYERSHLPSGDSRIYPVNGHGERRQNRNVDLHPNQNVLRNLLRRDLRTFSSADQIGLHPTQVPAVAFHDEIRVAAQQQRVLIVHSVPDTVSEETILQKLEEFNIAPAKVLYAGNEHWYFIYNYPDEALCGYNVLRNGNIVINGLLLRGRFKHVRQHS